ncbi:unnamed protein product [Penicillium salamii]|uniref:Uncharacterized protein n=1 Tax=Penicillium salamii TaxID=1612424 RepID=A0A9W4JIZ1_9EURO|nr:unnamed protein product [Penicillium salamii]CAG8148304.1 unnamed protein product [Penicillium salamii]CAG8377961.1 unnamed protein product [Penicillium salamii]CAG8379405.1 unnamed protein product [Penicillium salamii]CAG8382747.1 unnamed protein product [Penicillium salamii]
MTVFIASLFLPYTIDFDPHGPKKEIVALSSSYAVDGSGSMACRDHRFPDGVANIAQSIELPLTPGATRDNERVFTDYTPRTTDEIRFGLSPSEPRDVIWGRSQKFNQPQSQATETPTSSILSITDSQKATVRSLSIDGTQDCMELGEPRSPQTFVSSVEWRIESTEKGLGGLTNAVHAAEKSGFLQNKLWVGTLGMPTDSLMDSTREDIARYLREEHQSLTVFVDDTEFEGHYTHFCHAVLWPALHYQMQESPRHSEYERYSWDQYIRLNAAFADAIVERWQPGDKIWVHDYHLLVLPGILRKRIPQAEIGFFLHTPFPSSEVFRCLSPRDQLLDGILGADLVGFQTEEYRNHFLQSCSRLRRLNTSASEVSCNGRAVRAVSIPMGIDPSFLKVLLEATEVQGWIHDITHRYPTQRLIVARDRLDVSGGIKQRLLAYELFLNTYPDFRHDIVLIQVISSAGAVPELEAQISKIAMRINTTYSSAAHQPLVLLKRDINTHQVLALLSIAEIFIATGLREGINLTSHEFILCQDKAFGSRGHGSLIISEFVGSASMFHERSGARFNAHKLLVNPWDLKECAEAIRVALQMSPAQKMIEWRRLRRRMSKFSAIKWYRGLQLALNTSCTRQSLHRVHDTLPLSLEELESSYNAAKSRLFFIEDGDILGPDPLAEGSLLSERAFKILEAYFRKPQNKLYLISSKTLQQLNELFPQLPPEVGIISENGAMIRHPNTRACFHFTTMSAKWLPGIQKMMEYFQERTEGSRIETFPWSLVFHYDGALDREAASHQASELADQINGARGEAVFHIVRDETSITVELPLSVQGRGRAAHYILQYLTNAEYPELVLVAGKSPDSESLFCWANELAGAPTPSRLYRTGFGHRLWVTTLATGPHVNEAKCALPPGFSFLKLMGWLLN